MKKIILILLFSTSVQFVFAQPTQAEINKMIKEAQADIEKMKKDPQNKDLIKNMPKLDTIKINPSKGHVQTKIENKNPDTALLQTNDKLLNSLPIRCFNRAELISYIHNLNSKLTEYLRNSYRTDITNIPIIAVKQPGTPIGLWMKGKINESVLVVLKSSELNPDNNLIINNAGGILTSCGLAVYGIPILEYALQKQPDNNMLLNNLGQAFLDLGDDKKAEQYLLKCVNSYNYYPDANLALAYIYKKRGNKPSALRYVENSIRGAWSVNADNLLRELKPDAKLMDYVRHRYKQPEHFNIHKYPLLPPCLNVNDAPVLKARYDAYQTMLSQLAEKYRLLSAKENDLGKKEDLEKTMNVQKEKHLPFRPFGMFASQVRIDLEVNEYQDKLFRHKKYQDNYDEEIMKLRATYKIDLKKVYDKWNPRIQSGEGNGGEPGAEAARCKEINELGNSYLPQFAALTKDYQLVTLPLYNNYLNDISYWSYISSWNDHSYRAIFYDLVVQMIRALEDINTTEFIFPCKYEKVKSSIATELEIVEPDCFLPVKGEADLGAFKMEVSCEGYKLEAGEGLVGKIEYNRGDGNLTLAFGVGASVPRVLFKTPGMKVGLEGEAKAQLYLTIDNTGSLVDGGILYEAAIKAIAELGSIKASTEVGEGLTAGFGTGVQLKEGSHLKQAIDKIFPVQPDDIQMNKSVPLYKKPLNKHN